MGACKKRAFSTSEAIYCVHTKICTAPVLLYPAHAQTYRCSAMSRLAALLGAIVLSALAHTSMAGFADWSPDRMTHGFAIATVMASG